MTMLRDMLERRAARPIARTISLTSVFPRTWRYNSASYCWRLEQAWLWARRSSVVMPQVSGVIRIAGIHTGTRVVTP